MKTIIVAAALATAVAVCPGCARGPGTSDLYLLEELETATAVEDAAKRIERLAIFADKHKRHPYRALAVERMLEAAAGGGELLERARAYFEGALERESDPALRGRLLLAEFRLYSEADTLRAAAVARKVLASGETDYRLLLHMAYGLMNREGQAELADSVLQRLIEIGADPVPRAHARTVYAEFLSARGRGEEALEQLQRASAYPFANRALGERLWESGERAAAVEAYIRLAAGVPGARAAVKLDSLHALVHPGSPDLERRIQAERIELGPQLPQASFVDAGGRRHSIPASSGAKLVLVAFSPT